MINVYYGFTEAQIPSIAQPKPLPLISELKSIYGGFNHYKRMVKCPSFRDQIARTYVIKSPASFSVRLNALGGIDCTMQNCANAPHLPHIEIFPEDQPVFISEASLTMELLPAYMHPDALKFPFLGGQYDIGKWVRPVHSTYFLEEGQVLEIKQDQPLMYVRFSKPVRLQEFAISPKLLEELRKTMDLKRFRSFPKLADLYQYYAQTNRKKLVMQEVKKGLL